MKTSIACMIVALICTGIGFSFGYIEGSKTPMSEKRIQATYLCFIVEKEFVTIAYQTKSKIWSIQCK